MDAEYFVELWLKMVQYIPCVDRKDALIDFLEYIHYNELCDIQDIKDYAEENEEYDIVDNIEKYAKDLIED